MALPPVPPVPHPNNWTQQLSSPNASYPAQYGSPPSLPQQQWSQPPPTPPAPQWTTYASPPPSSVAAPTFYPNPATPSPSFWVGQTQSPSDQQFSQKIGIYAPSQAGGYPHGAATPTAAPAAGVAPHPTYPTQYPNIPKAQYPSEFYANSMGQGLVTSTTPIVAYPGVQPQRGTLFATQQQVNSSQSFHPYRRQP